MCHLISVVSAYIFGAVRNLKSTLPAVLFLLVSSFAVTAQASITYDFEGNTANLNDEGAPDGYYSLSETSYEAYGGGYRGVADVVQEDGTSSAMLKFTNSSGAQAWSGFTLANGAPSLNFRGDATANVTMTVLSDQDGTINLELESGLNSEGNGPADSYVLTQQVVGGFNELSFDLSGADDSINWHKIQIRVDADGGVNAAETTYHFDDIVFPNASNTVDVSVQVEAPFVFFFSNLLGWDSPAIIPAASAVDGVFTYSIDMQDAPSFEYYWSVAGSAEDLSLLPENSCDVDYINSDYSARVYNADAGIDIPGQCIV